MRGGKVLENLEGFRKFQAEKQKKLNAIAKEKGMRKMKVAKKEALPGKTSRPRFDYFQELGEMLARQKSAQLKPPPPPPPSPCEIPVVAGPAVSTTLLSSPIHVDDGAITISRDRNPVTGVPCFIIRQAFPNRVDQQIFVNDKSLPQFVNFIINFLV
jgi:hypothetical protein